MGGPATTSPPSASSATRAPANASTDADPGAGAPRVVVYRGPAGCDGCSEAAAEWIHRQLPDATVQYAGPAESLPVDDTSLAGVALYVQPGGDADVDVAYRALGDKAAGAIRTYVAAGGRYLGICEGAYLAGSDPGLDLLSPADTDQYISFPGALVTGEADTLVPVRWRGGAVDAYFQDGSYVFGDLAGAEVIATYADGPPDAVLKSSGSGAVGVIGTHPEAPTAWYAEAGLPTSGMAGNQAVGNELLSRLMAR